MADGNLYIPVWFADVSLATATRYTYIVDGASPTSGLRITWAKRTNIWVISLLEGGTIRPAYHWAAAPDDSDWAGPTTSNNYNYYSLNCAVAGKYAEWDVPAGAAGCDKIVVTYYSNTAGGSVKLQVDRGEGYADEGGVVDTLAGSNVLGCETTITLDAPLASGHKVKIVRSGISGLARIHGIRGYDSDGTWSAGKEMTILSTTTVS